MHLQVTPNGWRSEQWLAITRSALMQIEIGDTDSMPQGPEESLLEYLGRVGATVPNIATLALIYEFRKLYGAGVARAYRQLVRFQDALARFQELYGPGPVDILRAPARINIIGEHVDYVSYLPTEVLAFGSRQHDMLMLFRPRLDTQVRGASSLEGIERSEFDLRDFEFECPAADEPEAAWLAYLLKIGVPKRHWMNYVRGAVGYARVKHREQICRGFEFHVDSTIPAAGGASSSSALCVLAGAAVRLANGTRFTLEELADDSSRAEWYIGTRGGKMDHTVLCLSDRQAAINIHFVPSRVHMVPLHRYRFRWVTFYAHAADKSGHVMQQYNERSATSCLLIPALLDQCFQQRPELRDTWDRALRQLTTEPLETSALEDVMGVLDALPQDIDLARVRSTLPDVYAQLRARYPMLTASGDESEVVFKVRPRAHHHVGEIRRVRQAVEISERLFSSGRPESPEDIEPGLRRIGELMVETHKSMDQLYELSTPDVEDLIHAILAVPGVYGARLMGGGFGGNVLALTQKDSVERLLEDVQAKYYGPRGRDWAQERAVMISTAGRGISAFDGREQLQHVILTGTTAWWKWPRNEAAVLCAAVRLVGVQRLEDFRPSRKVKPIVVAGGKGRIQEGTRPGPPKPLIPVGGTPCFLRVIEAFERLPFPVEPPVVVVSPDTQELVRQHLGTGFAGEIVIQETPLGTGHAALQASHVLEGFDGVATVVWGTQPLLQTRTIFRSLLVQEALGYPPMTFPTAVTERPYAPIDRDASGHVVASSETALEGARVRSVGETNIGMFLLDAAIMVEALAALHAEAWDAKAGRYRRPRGELGFPNEMVRLLHKQDNAVVAVPLAQTFEPIGIRTTDDVAEAEHVLASHKECE